MIKAFFYKEWIKTRKYFALVVIIGLILEAYMFLKLGRSFRFAGYEHLWDVVINKNQFLFSYLKYYPFWAGLILGILQFLPEISNFRIKLSLHLPLKETRIIFYMLSYGVISLVILFVLLSGILFLGASHFFAKEIVSNYLLTTLPWFFSGLCGYFLFAFCAFEPVWKRKLVNICLSAFLLYFFFITDFPAAYEKLSSIIILCIIPLIGITMVYYSIYRFKIGVQASYR